MKNRLIGSIVLLLVLVVGGWYIVSGWVKPPEERVGKSFANLIGGKNGHIKSEISLQPRKDNQANFQEIKITTDGDFQKGKEGILELVTTFSVLGQTPGASLSGKGEAMLTNGKVFYRIDEIPPIFSDADKIIGRWIEGSSNVNVLSDVFRGNILEALKNQKIFAEAKKIGNEKVDGIGTTHIQVKLSSAGYASFLAELVKQSSGDTSITKEQIEKNISQLESLPFDVWLDSANNLRKINIIRTDATNGSTTNISIYFSKFEGKLKIEAPKDVLRVAIPAASLPPVVSPASK